MHAAVTPHFGADRQPPPQRPTLILVQYIHPHSLPGSAIALAKDSLPLINFA